jgi:hypothetical protein
MHQDKRMSLKNKKLATPDDYSIAWTQVKKANTNFTNSLELVCRINFTNCNYSAYTKLTND